MTAQRIEIWPRPCHTTTSPLSDVCHDPLQGATNLETRRRGCALTVPRWGQLTNCLVRRLSLFEAGSPRDTVATPKESHATDIYETDLDPKMV